MLETPKKEKFLSQKLLGGLFSGLGFVLSLVLISLGVYLVLAVAPGTTNPISPPPGNDVVWDTAKSCPVGQAIRSFNVANTNPPACEAVGASGCSSGILTAGANVSLSTGASWDPCAGGATISYSGTGSLWTQSGANIYYNAGNVGVGTVSPPGAKLDVQGGNINTSGVYQQNGTLGITGTFRVERCDTCQMCALNVNGGIITSWNCWGINCDDCR